MHAGWSPTQQARSQASDDLLAPATRETPPGYTGKINPPPLLFIFWRIVPVLGGLNLVAVADALDHVPLHTTR
jgi:hypothetical protein